MINVVLNPNGEAHSFRNCRSTPEGLACIDDCENDGAVERLQQTCKSVIRNGSDAARGRADQHIATILFPREMDNARAMLVERLEDVFGCDIKHGVYMELLG